MKRLRNGTVVFSGDDIAEAFNRPLPSTACTGCPHTRGSHRREIVKPGAFDGIEAHHECQKRDRRTKTGTCKCTQFTAAKVAVTVP